MKYAMQSSYDAGVAFWRESKEVLDVTEEQIPDLRPDTLVRLDIVPRISPPIERGGSKFRGSTAGISISAGLGSVDLGMVRGEDHGEKSVGTIYTADRLRCWAVSLDNNNFIDVMAYLNYCFTTKRPVRVAGRLILGKNNGYPELKIKMIEQLGINEGIEYQLLNEEYMETAPKLSRLRKELKTHEENLAYWHTLIPMDEKQLIEHALKNPDKDLEARVRVIPAALPLIERGDAVFYGWFGGAGIKLGPMTVSIGTVRGEDKKETNAGTFFSKERLLYWTRSPDHNSFMDAMGFLSLSCELKEPVEIGGRLLRGTRLLNGKPTRYPEFKIEYVKMEGPKRCNCYEEVILNSHVIAEVDMK